MEVLSNCQSVCLLKAAKNHPSIQCAAHIAFQNTKHIASYVKCLQGNYLLLFLFQHQYGNMEADSERQSFFTRVWEGAVLIMSHTVWRKLKICLCVCVRAQVDKMEDGKLVSTSGWKTFKLNSAIDMFKQGTTATMTDEK